MDQGRQSNKMQWVCRVLIAIVLFWNLQAALLFMLSPSSFVAVFELQGISGKAAVIGVGILFLMWQVPYVFALINPLRFKISLYEAIIMQGIGLVAESLLYARIPSVHAQLRSSILRFIVFDGIGLILLLLALLMFLPSLKTRLTEKSPKPG